MSAAIRLAPQPESVLFPKMRMKVSSIFERTRRIFKRIGRTARSLPRFSWQVLLGTGLTLLLALPTLLAVPARAADTLHFSFGLLESSLTVASLETFAKEGRVESDLTDLFRLLGPNEQAELRTVLTTTHRLSPVTVSQSFYEPMGERVLSYLGSLIQTGQRQNGLHALRAALILSAAQPDGFTLLDVLRRFPTSGIRFDLREMLEAGRRGQQFFRETNAVIAGIEDLARATEAASPFSPTDLPDLRRAGDVPFTKQSFMLSDPSRDRRYPADLYLPEVSGSDSVPVVVLSHGLGSDREDFADVAEHFASYGFAVAVPEHVGSNFELQQAVLAGRASEVFHVSEFVDRPKDISFLLDELERRNASEWQDRLNLEQVALAGHSFGGYGVLVLGGATVDFEHLQQSCNQRILLNALNPALLLQCRALEVSPADRQQLTQGLADPRVKLVIAFNPVNASIFGPKGLAQVQVPVVIGASGYDPAAPLVPEQAVSFTWLTGPEKYLLLARGGAHTPQLTALVNRILSPSLDADQLAEDITLFRSNARAVMLAFVKVYLAGNREYERYLQPYNIQTLGDPPFEFSLIRSLSEAQLAQMLR